MEPLRFDVSIEPMPHAVVTDGTVCARCGGVQVIVLTRMVEVQRIVATATWEGVEYPMPEPPAFAVQSMRVCRGCGATCR